MSRPMTPDELIRAAEYLYGIARAATGPTIALPVRTVERLADAIVATVNGTRP